MNIELPKNLSAKFKNFSSIPWLQITRKLSRFLVWLVLVGGFSLLGLFWYQAFYSYQWSEERKAEHRREYAGQTSFREERFNATVKMLEERTRLHQALPQVKKDIFFGTTY